MSATREEFLRAVWDELIDVYADGQWIDNYVASANVDASGAFADAGQSLKALMALGIDRQQLSTIARAIAYETAFSLLYMFNDPGIDPNEGTMLHESLLSADPSGREGRPPFIP